MKRLFFLLTALVLMTGTALAQQPTVKEIYEKAMSVMDQNKGFQADMTFKVLKMSFSFHMSVLGNRSKMVTEDGNTRYSDGKTVWTYDKKKNAITIENESQQDGKAAQTNMLNAFAQGYDSQLSKTVEGWLITFKKKKTNQDKDAVNSAEMVVNSQTYHPISLKFKKGLMTLTIGYKNIKTGMTAENVTYSSSRYPGAKVTDKRK